MRRSYPGKTSLGPLRHSDLCCQSAYPFWRIYYVPAKKKSLTLKSVLHRVPPSSVLQEFRLGMTLEPVYFWAVPKERRQCLLQGAPAEAAGRAVCREKGRDECIRSWSDRSGQWQSQECSPALCSNSCDASAVTLRLARTISVRSAKAVAVPQQCPASSSVLSSWHCTLELDNVGHTFSVLFLLQNLWFFVYK